MTFSPTATLAFILATGVAGAAMAQSTAAPSAAPTNPQPAAQNVQANWQPGQAQPNVIQPPAGGAQMQTGSSQAQAGTQQQPPAARGPAAGDEQVKQAQQQLQYGGFYNGPVDGIMDPDTRAAIARFQQEHGLRRTQSLDRATMNALLGGPPAGSGTSAATAPTPAAGQTTAPAPTGAGGTAAGQSMGR